MTDNPTFQIEDRNDFPRWLASRGLTGSVVELGVLFGEYSEHFLDHWPGILHMVDPWIQQDSATYRDGCNAVHMPMALERTLRTVKRFGDRAHIMRMLSNEAAGHFADNSLDGLVIDANHSYKSVREDIALWWGKVHTGGCVSGHDFYSRHDEWQDCGVKEAVSDFARENRLTVHLTPCTSWFILKP